MSKFQQEELKELLQLLTFGALKVDPRWEYGLEGWEPCGVCWSTRREGSSEEGWYHRQCKGHMGGRTCSHYNYPRSGDEDFAQCDHALSGWPEGTEWDEAAPQPPVIPR